MVETGKVPQCHLHCPLSVLVEFSIIRYRGDTEAAKKVYDGLQPRTFFLVDRTSINSNLFSRGGGHSRGDRLGGLSTTTRQLSRGFCTSCQSSKPWGSLSWPLMYFRANKLAITAVIKLIHLAPTMTDPFDVDDEVESVLFVQPEISGTNWLYHLCSPS